MMTTLSATQARANLSSWLKKAAAGESVGILYHNQIISLQPVQVEVADYAQNEYQISDKEMTTIEKKLSKVSRAEIKSKKTKPFKGNLETII